MYKRQVQLLIEYADAKGIEETVYSAKWEVEPQAFDVDIDRIKDVYKRQVLKNNCKKTVDIAYGRAYNPVFDSYRRKK